MTSSRQLVHIASSDSNTSVVLDIARERMPTREAGPLPLAIRKMNPYRVETQSWRFTEVASL